MPHKVLSLECEGCGAPVRIGQTRCEYCGRPVVITTFNSVYDMEMPQLNKFVEGYKQELEKAPNNREYNHGVGSCYFLLGLKDKALTAFEKAMEDNFDRSETFINAAICLLDGRKACTIKDRRIINKIERYIQAALKIEELGIYYYFWAYIKYDYYSKKYLNTKPDWKELLDKANRAGVSQVDKKRLFELLGVEKPSCL